MTAPMQLPLYCAIGLETTSDPIREKCINKGFSYADFTRAAATAHAAGAGVKAYLLFKPLFLTEAEAVADMKSSLSGLTGRVEMVSMNPCTVQKRTELEMYWKQGAYRPPYLWSVLSLLKDAPVEVTCDPLGGGQKRGPHNCGMCDYEIVRGIRRLFSYRGSRSHRGAAGDRVCLQERVGVRAFPGAAILYAAYEMSILSRAGIFLILIQPVAGYNKKIRKEGVPRSQDVRCFFPLLCFSICSARRGKNVPASETIPMACVVPRSISFVTEAGLMSTHTVFTPEGRQLPTAIECRRVATIRTILHPGICLRISSCATIVSWITSGRGPSSRIERQVRKARCASRTRTVMPR